MSTVKALVNRLRNRIFQFRVGPEALSHKNVWFAWSVGVGVIPDDDVTKPLIVSVGMPSQVLDVSDVHKNIGVEVCVAKCGKAVFVVGAQEYGNTTSLTDLAL